MPSAVFPRFSEYEPTEVTVPKMRTGHRNIAQSGVAGLRGVTAKGVRWREAYPPLKMGEANAEELLSWIDWAFNNVIKFTIEHPSIPGSGVSPNGSGSGGITVSGVNSGDTITVSGGTYEPGDVVRIATYGPVFRITESASSELNIVPSIINPTAGGEAVTTTSVSYNCIIEDYNVGSMSGDRLPSFYTDLTINFLEIPNA